MDNFENLTKRVISLEQRVNQLEGKTEPTNSPTDDDAETLECCGKFKSEGCGSQFNLKLNTSSLLEMNASSMARVIDAFSSEERVKIVTALMQNKHTATELMEILGFSTTGKLYHHLSFLEKLSIISKSNEKYFIKPSYISCILMIYAGAYRVIKKNHENE